MAVLMAASAAMDVVERVLEAVVSLGIAAAAAKDGVETGHGAVRNLENAAVVGEAGRERGSRTDPVAAGVKWLTY